MAFGILVPNQDGAHVPAMEAQSPNHWTAPQSPQAAFNSKMPHNKMLRKVDKPEILPGDKRSEERLPQI